MKPHPDTETIDPPDAPVSGHRWRSPGLDAATLDAREGERSFAVRLPDGERIVAELAPGVSPDLAEECLAEGRLVLVRLIGESPHQILGALQTEPSAIAARDGVVTVAGREVRLEAEHAVTLGAGASRLRLGRDGKLAVLGSRLTMQIASLIKLIASKVELP